MTAFLRRTVVGGTVTVLVAGTIASILWHALSVVRKDLEQVAAVLSLDTAFPVLTALSALVMLALAAGLLLQVPPIHNLVESGMGWLSDRFRFSRLLHGFELELAGLGESPIKSVLVTLGDHQAPAFLMEDLSDGRCVVFVPGSPNPSHGSVYVLPRENVRRVEATHFQMACCISNWGAGLRDVLERVRASE
jgi:uncharacterized membrane protein